MPQHKIIIVGAGPVGLCTALSLARAGIQTLVIDAKPEWSCVGSRAIVIDHGSLRHFGDIGCLDEIIRHGIVAHGRRTYFQGKELYSQKFASPSANIPLFVNLPQSRTERLLLDALIATGRADIRWGHQVVDVTQSATDVTITAETSEGVKTITGTHLLAADGSRSKVRTLTQMGFPGTTNPYNFLIVDVEACLHDVPEHHFHFDHPTNPGHTLLMVPQPGNIWRIDWQLPLGTEPHLSEDALDQRVRSLLGSTPFKIKWSSCYKFHQRLIPAMTRGRIHFLGDAAHLVNPFGGRGMNSGIQDARAIACKLIQIVNRGASEDVLAAYSPERMAANRIHQRITARSMKFIAPSTPVARTVRNLVLRGSRHIRRFQRLVDSGKMSMVSPTTHVMDFPGEPATA